MLATLAHAAIDANDSFDMALGIGNHSTRRFSIEIKPNLPGLEICRADHMRPLASYRCAISHDDTVPTNEA